MLDHGGVAGGATGSRDSQASLRMQGQSARRLNGASSKLLTNSSKPAPVNSTNKAPADHVSNTSSREARCSQHETLATAGELTLLRTPQKTRMSHQTDRTSIPMSRT